MTSTINCSMDKEKIASILSELVDGDTVNLRDVPLAVIMLGKLQPAYPSHLITSALLNTLGFENAFAIFEKARCFAWSDVDTKIGYNAVVTADTFIEYISEANNHAINTLREYVKELESTPIAEVQTRDYINIWVSDPSKDIPKPGSIWTHRTKVGDYEVMYVTNERSTDPDKWPVTVVYRETGKSANASVPIWSRPLVDWFTSMEPTHRVVE